MTMETVQATRVRSAALAKNKLWLVTNGDEIGKAAKGTKEWLSQARGIWDAARTETEPTVILNLLRYQFVRNKKNWAPPVFDSLETRFKECIEKAGGDGALALDLMRHLMVYTIRSFVFWNKKDEPASGAGEPNGAAEAGS